MGIFLPIFFAFIIVVVSQKLIHYRRYVIFLVLAVIILVLSLSNVMPRSWTHLYDEVAALRQFAPLLILPFLATASFVYFIHRKDWIQRNSLKILLLIYSLHLIIPLLCNSQDAYYGTLYTITNHTVPIWIVFVLWVFRSGRSLPAAIIGFAVLMSLASSAQSLLVATMLPLIWFFPYRRAILWGLTTALFMFLVVTPFFPFELYQLDSNSGVRAVMWGDVLRLLADTGGVGVGFGTEYITNRFDLLGLPNWGLSTYNNHFFYLGTHSTFYDMLLRLGLMGLVLFLFWLYPILFSKQDMPQGRNGAIFTSVAVIFLIVNAVNVGIYSINFLFGGAMMLGFLQSLRYEQRQKSHNLSSARSYCPSKGGL